AHTELGHHVTGDLGRFLKIVLRPRRDVLENHLFGDAPAKQNVDPSQQLRTSHKIAVFSRQLLSITQSCDAARNNRNLIYPVRARDQLCNQRVSRFMIGYGLFLSWIHQPILSLYPSDSALDGPVDVFGPHSLLPVESR